jgi:hypothetical protein
MVWPQLRSSLISASIHGHQVQATTLHSHPLSGERLLTQQYVARRCIFLPICSVVQKPWIQLPSIFHKATASTHLLLSRPCQQPAFDVHDPCTRSPRYNTARRAHQTSPATAPPDRGSPSGTIGRPHARMSPLEQPFPPSTRASGIPHTGGGPPRDSLILSRVFVSNECLTDEVCKIHHLCS